MTPSTDSFSRRQFIQAMPFCALGMTAVAGHAKEAGSELSFGVITDLHYADKDTTGSRAYRDSILKLKKAMELFRREKVSFIVHLGDLIDQGEKAKELEWLETITSHFSKPWYPVLGNHDLATLSKSEFLSACGHGGKDGHYFFQNGTNLFVILDANYKADETPYNSGNFDWTDCWIPSAQQKWLREVLSEHADMKAVLFVHQNLDCDGDPHAVKNAPEIRDILEKSGNVQVVFQGHRHTGGQTEMNGVSYITLKAAVEGTFPESQAFGLVRIKEDGTVGLKGEGRQEDWAPGA